MFAAQQSEKEIAQQVVQQFRGFCGRTAAVRWMARGRHVQHHVCPSSRSHIQSKRRQAELREECMCACVLVCMSASELICVCVCVLEFVCICSIIWALARR